MPCCPCCCPAILFPGCTFYPIDPDVGVAKQVGDDVVTLRLKGKTAIVFGGTDGIGRATAESLARFGANVIVVGRSSAKGKSVVDYMTSVAKFPAEQQLKFFAADLLTVKGCMQIAKELMAEQLRFDFVVFTIGVWPDKESPRSADGIDKVLALDVVARYALTKALIPILNPDARVMSVLGSTARAPPPPAVATIKQLVTGEKTSYLTPQMLATAGVVNDTWFHRVAQEHPGIHLIGTFPGLVATDLVRTSKTFPRCIRPVLQAGQKLVALTPKECGRLHTQVLVSTNAGNTPVSYFNVLRLEGRRTNPLAYDKDFQDWVAKYLEETVARLK